MKCRICQADLPDSAQFCPQCGARLNADAADAAFTAPGDSPTAAATASPPSNADRLRPQPANGDDEEVELWSGSYSGQAMIGSWVLAGVVSIALIVAGIFIPMEAAGVKWGIVFGLIALVWLYFAAKLAWHKLTAHYRLTSQRLVHESGLLARVTDRIEVIDVNDVIVKQGFVERFLGVGTIIIESSDRSHPQMWMHGIQNVREVAGQIDAARRKERVRRGLHIANV